jgi:hypothetical protein
MYKKPLPDSSMQAILNLSEVASESKKKRRKVKKKGGGEEIRCRNPRKRRMIPTRNLSPRRTSKSPRGSTQGCYGMTA